MSSSFDLIVPEDMTQAMSIFINHGVVPGQRVRVSVVPEPCTALDHE